MTITPALTPGADALPELQKAVTAAVTDPSHTVAVPGTPDDVWTLSDTLVIDPIVQLIGEGAWIKRADHWKLPRPGSGHHLAVWQGSDNVAVVRNVGFDGNAAKQDNPFVGDTVRMQHIRGVDAEELYTKNNVGLTTSSSPTLSETFAQQYLHLQKARLVRCHNWNHDGGPTATGIVMHWVDTFSVQDTFSADQRGQGFGTFGQSTGTFDNCTAIRDHHGFNLEAGNSGEGGSVTVIGSKGIGCTTGVVLNGNYNNHLGVVSLDELELDSCGVPITVTGMPNPVIGRGIDISTPGGTAIVQALTDASSGQGWASLMQLAITLHSVPATIPVFVAGGKPQPTPSNWAVTRAA